jgi:hypothetical protein
MVDSPTPPPKPSPAHRKLEAFLGAWETRGTVHDAGAGRPFTAQDMYEWVPGGFFLLHRWDAAMPDGRIQGVEIIGYDAEKQSYRIHSYDSYGGSDVMRASEANGVWTFLGDKARFTGQFSDDGTVMEGRWEVRASERDAWRPWMDVRLTKVG